MRGMTSFGPKRAAGEAGSRAAFAGAPGAIGLAVATLLLGAPSTVMAEGSAGPELDDSQALTELTDLYVDVLDVATETFVWTGKGSVVVSDPDGGAVGTFASGATITPTIPGTYKLDLQEDQFDVDGAGIPIRSTIVPWGVEVFRGAEVRTGRLFSYSWRFNTGSFAQSAGTDASFYAMVPGGDAESFAVLDLRVDGLAGFVYEIQGNHTGVDGPNAGRSVPEMGNRVDAEYQIYLNPPERATYTVATPEVTDFEFRGGVEGGSAAVGCDQIVPGMSMGEFSFTTNVDGTFHLVCDLNGDDVFDIVDDGDFLILGDANPGLNTVPFDGLDNNGNPFSPGEHECMVRVTVGEFHYVGRDIETSFEGMRMFQVNPDRSRVPLDMYWNDALVQANAITMPAPFDYVSAETSGPDGVNAGDPADPPRPVGVMRRPTQNSRAWGDFVSFDVSMGNGKGNRAFLDTYTWLLDDQTGPITIRAVDGVGDSDSDGLTDYVETCITGTMIDNPDSDGDGVGDGTETRGGMAGVDTDRDGIIDALDPDDDGDLVPTIDEDIDGDGDPTNDDTDMDGTPNYLDLDDDGDGLDTPDEDHDGDGDPTNDDTDGDGIPDYLEPDSDGDGVGDGIDACPTVAETVNDYMDADGCPEDDNDADGVPDDIDNCPPPMGAMPTDSDHPTANDDQMDFDMDGMGDLCDDDIDGDGLPNAIEMPRTPACPECTGTDPRNRDTDGGGVDDGTEVDRGSDPLDPIDDPGPLTVSGGGLFTCSAVVSDRNAPFGLLLCLGMLLAWRRSSRGRQQ